MRKPRAPPKGERQRMRYAVVLYTDTTSKEAVADFMERYRRRKQREYRRQQRRWYFIKQRLFGIAGNYAAGRGRNYRICNSTAGALLDFQ